jgi:zinc protease
MKIIFSLCCLVVSTHLFASSFLESVKKENWNGMEVVWIEDNKFPKFTAMFYFEDGAINDPFPGLTQTTLEQLTSGTIKESQKEIADFFDFYSAKLRSSVTHEYNLYTVSALTKDMAPVMGKVCELFSEAQYPEKEIKSYLSRAKSQLKNLVTSHAALADRIFRKVSLEETPFVNPTEGTLKSYDKMNNVLLKERLQQLNQSSKRLYLTGPIEALEMKKIILKQCPWTSERHHTRVDIKKPQSQSSIYLIPVPGANQAQIRIGRYMTKSETSGKNDQLSFMSGFLGGGFTSKLVQELRVKRGLTYSAGAYASIQKDYGRTGIMTFSKNETAAEVISLIRDIFQDTNNGKFTEKEFKHQQGHQVGGFAFGFEEGQAFLNQLMIYDHQGRKYEELVSFPKTISELTPESLSQISLEALAWDKLTIVVVGDKSLEKSLSRIRPVRILNYEDFL